MSLNRRDFLRGAAGTSALLAMGTVPSSPALAGSCKTPPHLMRVLFAEMDKAAPEMVKSAIRQRYDEAFVAFSYMHEIAINGVGAQPAYKDLDETSRQKLLEELFAISGELSTHMFALRKEFASKGHAGIALDMLDLQIASAEGDYNERRPNVEQALALLDEPEVMNDAIALNARNALMKGIRELGGAPEMASKMAWDASQHMNPNHFVHFLPMVGPASQLVHRYEQLKKGKQPLAPFDMSAPELSSGFGGIVR